MTAWSSMNVCVTVIAVCLLLGGPFAANLGL